jgi:hypothetical protein
MNKIILLILLITSFPIIAEQAPNVQETPYSQTPVITSDMKSDEKAFNPREGHWITTFGFETVNYQVPFEFTGERENFRPGEQELYGGRLGIGREFYLGAGLHISTKIEGYYMGTLFEKVVNAAPEEVNEEFAFTKKTGQIYGGNVVQTLGFMFNIKTKNPFMDEMTFLSIEPFFEAGLGVARAYNRRNYLFDTGPTGVQEGYKLRIVDEIATQHMGGGINFTSSSGYFLYLKSTVHTLDVTKRKLNGFSRPDGQAPIDLSATQKKVETDPVTIYAIGGGYKF